MQDGPSHGRSESEVAQPDGEVAQLEGEVAQPDGLTRRESLKLASAALALATGLGIPLRAFAERPESAPELLIKWYWAREPGRDADGRLIHTQEVAERVARLLLSGEPGALQFKWYSTDGRTSKLLGDYYLPSELQMKVEYR